MASDAEQGQLQAAPESFLSKDLVENISRDGINPGRRSLLQGAFTAAAASMVAPSLMADDDPDIVNSAYLDPQSGQAGGRQPLRTAIPLRGQHCPAPEPRSHPN